MSETQNNIGHKLDILQQYPRDAVHIAVVAVTAGEILKAGEHIGFDTIKDKYVLKNVNTIGIVDPYLKEDLIAGEQFYMFLYPNSVISLTHHYIHPILDGNLPEIKARKVIYDWIDTWYYSYGTYNGIEDDLTRDDVYNRMLDQFKKEEKFNFSGRWRNEDDSEFDEIEDPRLKPIYDALEVITNKKATKEQREHYYSCCI